MHQLPQQPFDTQMITLDPGTPASTFAPPPPHPTANQLQDENPKPAQTSQVPLAIMFLLNKVLSLLSPEHVLCITHR